MRFCLFVLVCALAFAPPRLVAAPPDKRPMKVDDMFAFKRVAAPQVSPDGKSVVYQVTAVDLEKNTSSTALWLAPTDGKAAPRQLTDPQGKKDTNPRWSPDGERVLFESTRTGTPQLWVLTAGEEPKQLTTISTGAGGGIWSPDGTHVAFVSSVHPEFSTKPFAESDKLNKEKDDAIEKSPVKVKTFTKLFYRHWDEYVGDKRQHLFVIEADPVRKGGGFAAPHDATPGDRDANPTSSTFSSGDDYTFSPDGKFLVFTAVPAKAEAWSTNYDICRVPITNTSPKWETLTAGNKAADGGPKFAATGKKLAWRAQKTAGYEADKWDILVADCKADGTITGAPANATAKYDVSVNEFVWTGGFDRAFLFTADFDGATPVFMVQADGAGFKLEHGGGACGALSASRKRDMVTFTEAAMTHPPEVKAYYWPSEKAKPADVSRANEKLLAELNLPKPESVEVEVEGKVGMQMWVLKPPGFDAGKKWPVVYLVHGGPQGAWENGWSFRWNPQAWAAQGYVIVMPNPRGSTGFGQKYVERDYRRLGRQVLSRPHGRSRLRGETARTWTRNASRRPVGVSAAT